MARELDFNVEAADGTVNVVLSLPSVTEDPSQSS
jgi:hypothetical protein